MIIDMNGISKSFGAKTVLTNLDLKIEDHDRIGLIGENGAGKSTLLNIIIGDLEYDTGTFAKGTGKKIGFLRQDSGLALEERSFPKCARFLNRCSKWKNI